MGKLLPGGTWVRKVRFRFMWKESYRLGIDLIDTQHIELFRMVSQLLKAIDTHARKEDFKEVIEFLKNYVVFHFKEEEAYQEQIHYNDLQSHKKMHQDFTNTVLTYEKKLIATDYDYKVVKNLAGMLTAWLIYHVADADQKIKNVQPEVVNTDPQSCVDSFCASTVDMLEKMVGLNSSDMTESPLQNNFSDSEIFVEVGLTGDQKGSVVFGFSKELAFKLMEIMTFSEPEELDELVCSAMSEMANISSGNAATDLSNRGVLCDITPPVVSFEHQPFDKIGDGISIDTGIGKLQVLIKPESE